MTQSPPERDWKFIRKVHDELLASLCERINAKSVSILTGGSGSEHSRYLRLYRHIHRSDRIIGDCFNGLRRSTLVRQLGETRRHGILTDEHFARLSPETQRVLEFADTVRANMARHRPQQDEDDE